MKLLIVFLQLFLMQAALAAVVIWGLKKILDRQLMEIAIKKFRDIKLTQEDDKLNGIMVVLPGDISQNIKQRLNQMADEKFKRPMQLFTRKDRSLIGGMVIKLNSAVIDYSLIGRLREGRIINTKDPNTA